jgi:transcriptional regulator with XRE-family HTH domain
MTNIRKLLAANIKACRNELGLTQAKLAELANTATHYIAMIEGCKNFPSPEMIERIAAVLERDSTDLFALDPIQQKWKETILEDVDKLITQRIAELKQKSSI